MCARSGGKHPECITARCHVVRGRAAPRWEDLCARERTKPAAAARRSAEEARWEALRALAASRVWVEREALAHGGVTGTVEAVEIGD